MQKAEYLNMDGENHTITSLACHNFENVDFITTWQPCFSNNCDVYKMLPDGVAAALSSCWRRCEPCRSTAYPWIQIQWRLIQGCIPTVWSKKKTELAAFWPSLVIHFLTRHGVPILLNFLLFLDFYFFSKEVQKILDF